MFSLSSLRKKAHDSVNASHSKGRISTAQIAIARHFFEEINCSTQKMKLLDQFHFLPADKQLLNT
jgi:hypothetical protein